MSPMNQKQYTYLPPDLAEKLDDVQLSVRKSMAGMRQNQHRSDSLGSSVEFAEYREYYPGDPLNQLDWDVYARSDRFVVRESYEEVSADCYVLLDLSASMQFAHGAEMEKIAYGRYLAAGILYLMVNQGDSAGLITFDTGIREFFDRASTDSGLKPHLEYLDSEDTGGEGDIESALHEVTELVDGPAMVVLISDLLQESEPIIRGLHHLDHEKMDVTVFHVMDPTELSLSMDGLVELEDMETGSEMTVQPDAVRDLYVEQVNQHLDEIRTNCTNMQMDYHFSDTGKPVHELIMERCF